MRTGLKILATVIVIIAASTTLAAQVCNEAMVNFKWNWDNNKEDSKFSRDKKTFEPIYANNNFAAVTILGWAAEGRDWALAPLLHMQRHNANVQNVYRQCYAEKKSPEFWIDFAKATYRGQIDWNEIKQNVDWQKGNNAHSISNARANWQAYRNNGDRVALLRAMHFALSGQRHNESVMSQYRRAFNDNTDRFFSLL